MYLFLWGVYWYVTACEGENYKATLSVSIECGLYTLIALWFLLTYFVLAKYNIVFRSSWFQTFALCWTLYIFFLVISRRLNFICRRFGTLCVFHLHRQVGVEFYIYPPMKMEQTERSETSEYKIQTPGNYPEESIKYSDLNCRTRCAVRTPRAACLGVQYSILRLFLTEVFPCFSLSCKANARAYLAKMGHGPYPSQLVNCVVRCIVCIDCVVLCFVCV
jgi:hypothetical protein